MIGKFIFEYYENNWNARKIATLQTPKPYKVDSLPFFQPDFSVALERSNEIENGLFFLPYSMYASIQVEHRIMRGWAELSTYR